MAQRGAQPGNCNAAKNKAACRANKGWYKRSGASSFLKKHKFLSSHKQWESESRKLSSIMRRLQNERRPKR